MPMQPAVAEGEAAVFHPAGDAYPYATIELPGGFIGGYMRDGVMVVEIHPAPHDEGLPAIAIKVDDAPVLEEPPEPRGRHAKVRA